MATDPTPTGLDWQNTDPHAWAAAYLKAVNHDPEIVGTVDGTASWFATLIEVGRRNPRPDDDDLGEMPAPLNITAAPDWHDETPEETHR